jgi:hypothetical protein
MDTKPKYPDGDRPGLLEEGLEFQDFVADLLLKELGFPLTSFCSKKYQWKHGENRQGVEIKLDRRMAGDKATGNISIEVAEKSRADMPNWTPSGIMREDNTWLYVQGNYHRVMVFGKEILRLVYQKQYLDKVIPVKPTLKAFRMPIQEAERIALKIFDI